MRRWRLILWFALCLLLLPQATASLAAEDDRLLAVATTAPPPTASAPPPTGPLPAGTRYLAQTGHYLHGYFLYYWETNGGAARFGYPLSEEYSVTTATGAQQTQQLFEYVRFELVATGNGAVGVALGQLGREALQGQIFPPDVPATNTPENYYFPETGHNLNGNFLATWWQLGGLAFLGYPLSDQQTVGDHALQHFERGRLEGRPDGSVLLMPAGNELVQRQGWPQPERFTLTMQPTTVGQGGVASVRLSADHPFTLLGAMFDQRPVTLQATTGASYAALVGLGPDAAVGIHRLTVSVHDGDQQRAPKELQLALPVQETLFPHDRVYLPPGQEDLLDPAVAAQEAAIVGPLYATQTAPIRWSGPFAMPASGPITTEYGEMRAYNDGPFSSWHNGLDIGAPEGAPIVAPAPGRVIFTGTLPIRGNFTVLDHGRGVLTCYFHQSAILVQAGQEVNTGDLIGRVGTTGLSTGAHLHWEVRISGVPVSPWLWVTAPPPLE